LGSALATLIDGLSEIDLRRLQEAIISRDPQTGRRVAIAAAINALQACSDSSTYPTNVATYETWRRRQERPDEWPSGDFISSAFLTRWTTGLLAAGIELSADHIHRRSMRGEHTAEDLVEALRAWLKAEGDEDLRYETYLAWARAYVREHPGAHLPRNPNDATRFFGGWSSALRAAAPESLRRFDDRRRQADQELDRLILNHVKQAACELNVGSIRGRDWSDSQTRYLSKSVYGKWVEAHWAEHGNRGQPDAPRSSMTVYRRFGSWPAALAKAGV
jgi:hypothetical protein